MAKLASDAGSCPSDPSPSYSSPSPQVADVKIFEVVSPGYDPAEAVRIFVAFERVEGAVKAHVDLAGRFFGGKEVRGRRPANSPAALPCGDDALRSLRPETVWGAVAPHSTGVWGRNFILLCALRPMISPLPPPLAALPPRCAWPSSQKTASTGRSWPPHLGSLGRVGPLVIEACAPTQHTGPDQHWGGRHEVCPPAGLERHRLWARAWPHAAGLPPVTVGNS